jgi:phage shock protein A
VTAEAAHTIAALERQAADLEKKTKELRSRISALKQAQPPAPEQGGQTAGTASSHTAH